MSEQTATEPLRKLLKECGMAYIDNDDDRDEVSEPLTTTWEYTQCGYEMVVTAIEVRDVENKPYLDMDFHHYFTPEQAIAATLGRPKAKAHPYGYEPDTGAFDATRCECGCVNDISATYCNDCGGVIEIDMNAEKEIYHTPRHLVFAVKHDDGSLEFGGKRYVNATLDDGCVSQDRFDELAEAYDKMADQSAMLAHELKTLRGGTCRITASSTDGLTSDEPRQWFELSCGHSFKLYGLGRPAACPVCGKAVER